MCWPSGAIWWKKQKAASKGRRAKDEQRILALGRGICDSDFNPLYFSKRSIEVKSPTTKTHQRLHCILMVY